MTPRPLRKLKYDLWRALARAQRQTFVHYQDPLHDEIERARRAYEKALRQENTK